MLTWCLCFGAREAATRGPGDGYLIPKPLWGQGQADSAALGCDRLSV
jgi:hypothetical protein